MLERLCTVQTLLLNHLGIPGSSNPFGRQLMYHPTRKIAEHAKSNFLTSFFTSSISLITTKARSTPDNGSHNERQKPPFFLINPIDQNPRETDKTHRVHPPSGRISPPWSYWCRTCCWPGCPGRYPDPWGSTRCSGDGPCRRLWLSPANSRVYVRGWDGDGGGWWSVVMREIKRRGGGRVLLTLSLRGCPEPYLPGELECFG